MIYFLLWNFHIANYILVYDILFLLRKRMILIFYEEKKLSIVILNEQDVCIFIVNMN